MVGFWRGVLCLRAEIDRGTYFLLGILFGTIKLIVDQTYSGWAFGQPWLFSYYLGLNLGPPRLIEGADPWTVLVVCAVSAPFMYLGFALTLARIRQGGFSPWIAVLYFLPVLNFLMFVLLSIVPSFHGPFSGVGYSERGYREPTRWGPIAVTSIFVAPFIGAGLTLGSVVGFRVYGVALFFGVPFVMGFLAAWLARFFTPMRGWEGACAGGLSTIALGCGLLAFSIEGVICVLMALPLAAPVAMLGGMLGAWLGPRWTGRGGVTTALCLLVLPALMGFEARTSKPPLERVVSTIVVNAPPEVVWKHVVGFSEIPEPSEMEFRAGIAYPVRAEIQGKGVGAIRRCVFSTGAFVEPITAWNEPTLLAFDVMKNPPPMTELNPFGEPHPAHLDGYFVSERGQFRLMRIEDGNTLLEGTAWYRHSLFPTAYWRLWSNELIHRIHMRVLRHVKGLSESP